MQLRDGQVGRILFYNPYNRLALVLLAFCVFQRVTGRIFVMRELLAKRAAGVQQSSIRAVTRRIEAANGINLGQGTCELQPNPEILEAARAAISAGHNSYTLFDGISSLKEAIVDRCHIHNHLAITDNNVLVTMGATGGLECVCKCFLEEGDEVILFEPIYQYHVRLVVER